MSNSRDDNFARRIGTGGERQPMEIVTHGLKRFEVSAILPAMTGQAAATSPDAPTVTGTGTWFFRDRGDGKSQFCIRYPSGAVQILATEP